MKIITILLSIILFASFQIEKQPLYSWSLETAKTLEKRDLKSLLASCDLYTKNILSMPWVRDERIKNTRIDIEEFVSNMKGIDKCFIQKTTDTKEYTITLISITGNKSTLWIMKNGDIRAITPY